MKKLLLIALAFSVILSTAMLPAKADTDSKVVMPNDYTAFVNALGIIKVDDEYNPDQGVTRERFSEILLNIWYRELHKADTSMEASFDDVPKENPYFSSIEEAVYYGLMFANERSFKPSEQVSFDDLCYGLLSAIHQRTIAKELGGYPSGYTQLANIMRMFDGVSLTDSLTYDMLAKIICNMLEAECIGINAKDPNSSYGKTGETVLEAYYGIKYVEGKLITGRSVGGNKDTVEVGDKSFSCNIAAERLLGQNVKAYYNKEMNEIVYLERCDNKNLLIFYNEIEKYENGVLTYKIDEKTYTARFDGKVTAFKNGMKVDFSDRLFYLNEGFINIIQNMGSRAYDTVISTESETVVVNKVDTFNRVIYDMYDPGKKIDLGSNDSEVIILKGDEEIELSDLKLYDSLMVVYPEGGECVTIYVSDVCINGVLSGLGADYVVLNGTKHYWSQYFADNHKPLSLGSEYNLYVDMLGRVVAMQETKNTRGSYVYFMDAAEDGGFSGENVSIKYMDKNGEIQVSKLASKIRLNNEKVKASSLSDPLDTALRTNFIYDAVNGYTTEIKDFYVRQPMRIKLNEDGLITDIDTAIQGNTEKENSLDLDLIIPSSTTLRYRSSPRQFGSKFGLSSECLIFGVPNTENDSKEARDLLRDEHYAVLSSSSAFRNDSYYGDLYVFDVSDGGATNLLVKRTKASTKSVEPDSSSSIFLVTDVMRGLNDEYEVTWIISGYMEGKPVSYSCANDDIVMPYKNGDALGITDVQRSQMIRRGDIIQISLNNAGEIDGITYRYDCVNKKIVVPSDIFQNGLSSDDAYKGYYGKVYKNDIDGLRMSDGVNGEINDFSTNNLNTFMAKSMSLIYVYDAKSTKVRVGTWEELLSSEVSVDDASCIYVRTRWGDPMQMVIYQ